jgi:D-tyrosyl-tRNA(Tyr) deacylase
VDAAPGAVAEPLYELFVHELQQECGSEYVKTGVFGAMMDVALLNDGPVTVTVESKG